MITNGEALGLVLLAVQKKQFLKRSLLALRNLYEHFSQYFLKVSISHFYWILFSSSSERMEKEAEEERMRRQRAAAERAFQDAMNKARLVMRRTPLGTDRNHNRSVLHLSVEKFMYILRITEVNLSFMFLVQILAFL